MAVKGVTKKITWVPDEATATSLSQCSLNFANLVGAALERSIFKLPFESDTYFSERQPVRIPQLCKYSSVDGLNFKQLSHVLQRGFDTPRDQCPQVVA